MTSDLDIYRSAKVLIGDHGEATLEAAMRAGATAGAESKIGLAISISALCPCSTTIDP